MPERRAFAPRRQITAGSGAGIAKTHREQSDKVRIVKVGIGKTGPLAEPIAAVVLPGNAALVNAGAWSLSDDYDARLVAELNDWPRSRREVGGADGTGPNFSEKSFGF